MTEPTRGGWSTQMRGEMGRLPETARNIREASENLKVVSEQLVDVSAMLNRIVKTLDAAGVVDALARLEVIARDLESMRAALKPPTSVDDARQRIEQMETLVSGITDRVWRTLGLRGAETAPTDLTTDADVAADPDSEDS